MWQRIIIKKLTKPTKSLGIEVKVRDTKGKVPWGISPGVDGWGGGIVRRLTNDRACLSREGTSESRCVCGRKRDAVM